MAECAFHVSTTKGAHGSTVQGPKVGVRGAEWALEACGGYPAPGPPSLCRVTLQPPPRRRSPLATLRCLRLSVSSSLGFAVVVWLE